MSFPGTVKHMGAQMVEIAMGQVKGGLGGKSSREVCTG